MVRHEETKCISFLFSNRIVLESSDERKSTRERQLDTFDEARAYFLEMIGALYLDGYR